MTKEEIKKTIGAYVDLLNGHAENADSRYRWKFAEGKTTEAAKALGACSAYIEAQKMLEELLSALED